MGCGCGGGFGTQGRKPCCLEQNLVLAYSGGQGKEADVKAEYEGS